MTDHRAHAPRHAADPSTVVEPEHPTLAQRAIESDSGGSRWKARVVAPLALAALAVTGVGLSALASNSGSDGLGAESVAATPTAVRDVTQVSRNTSRPALATPWVSPTPIPTPKATPAKATVKAAAKPSAKPAPAAKKAAAPAYPRQLGELIATRYLTTALNARSGPGAGYPLVATLPKGTAVRITATAIDGYRQVSRNGRPVWVKSEYLTRTKPVSVTTKTSSATTTKTSTRTSSSTTTSTSAGVCSSGSGVEAGLVYNAVRVHRVVCSRWPSITGYGGVRGTADAHGTGNALDIMVTGSLGWDVANYLRANASSLGITEVIFSQKIWTSQRSSEGWRSMSDRGSVTANHYDHVHVTVR